jgi:glyoxylase-like metal-dependent hydrolase (beta-lactamase superfamily II)
VPTYAEGLYNLGKGCYAWMVPNGSWGESNAGLVVGKGQSLLIDTLWDLDYTGVMLDAMGKITSKAPIRTVINTHSDGDHFWGNELLGDAEIITSQASLDDMTSTKPKSMILLERIGKVMSAVKVFDGDKAGNWFQQMVAPYDFGAVTLTPARRAFEGGLTLDVGGRKVECIEVGPAHTAGDLIVFVPHARLVYTADILFIGSTPVMWAGPVENWLAALHLLETMDADTFVPGHGPITDKAGIAMVRSYWEFVAEEVGKRFKAGMAASDAAYDIVLSAEFARQPFSSWNSPERIMTSTHTIYRHLNGKPAAPKVPELIGIMRKQAILAYELPHAQPAVMRQR